MSYPPPSRWHTRRKDCAALAAGVAVAVVGTFGLLTMARAAGSGLKPGLWDVRLVHQIVDGHDISAQLTEAIAKAQTALAKLPPEERARAQAMLEPAGVNPGNNASYRICVSAAMAASDLPVLDKDGSCRPTMLSHKGDRSTFRIDCTVNGMHMQGQGQAVSAGDVITSSSDITTRAADGSMHTTHNETQMHYVGADCGALQPPR
jgi:hypothetical protein